MEGVTMKPRCPCCHSSDDIIEWDDGYLCREYGAECDGPCSPDDEDTDDDEADEPDMEDALSP